MIELDNADIWELLTYIHNNDPTENKIVNYFYGGDILTAKATINLCNSMGYIYPDGKERFKLTFTGLDFLNN